MNQKIQLPPFGAERRENRIDAGNVFDVARQYGINTERLRERPDALSLRVALERKGKLGALRVERFCDAPGNRMIIGDTHDQAALCFHQVLHIAPYPITPSLCSLAPLFAGRGLG